MNDVCPFTARKLMWDPYMNSEVKKITVYPPGSVPWFVFAGIFTGLVIAIALWCLILRVLLVKPKKNILKSGD